MIVKFAVRQFFGNHRPFHSSSYLGSKTFIRKYSMETSGTPRRCKIGLIQLQSTPDKEASFQQARDFIERAHSEGARVVFLPEACDYVGDSRDYTMSSAESLEGETVKKYRQLAAKLGVWISLGGIHVKPDDDLDSRISNTHVMLDHHGDVAYTYVKTHLFDVDIPGRVRLKETDFTRPGRTIGPPVHTPAGLVGLAIDMRFPELSTALAHQGAEILTFPSAFTVPTGRAHWEVLLRARAIENQCYVVAAAQVGQHHKKRASYGHAMVVDPWGVVLSDLGEDIGYSVVDLDLDEVSKRRQEMPVRKHRRDDLYSPPIIHASTSIDSVPVYQFGQVTIPSSCVFFRSPLSFAFVNRKPVIPGHVLVSPVRVAPRYDDLTRAELADLALTVQTVSEVIEKQYGCTSRTIGLQDGPEAGQSIRHVHYHILPRKGGDFKRNDDIYEKLETHDKDVAPSDWRSVEDMTTEAATLRKLFT